MENASLRMNAKTKSFLLRVCCRMESFLILIKINWHTTWSCYSTNLRKLSRFLLALIEILMEPSFERFLQLWLVNGFRGKGKESSVDCRGRQWVCFAIQITNILIISDFQAVESMLRAFKKLQVVEGYPNLRILHQQRLTQLQLESMFKATWHWDGLSSRDYLGLYLLTQKREKLTLWPKASQIDISYWVSVNQSIKSRITAHVNQSSFVKE